MEAYKHVVQYYETDKMSVTHHSNYIRWMEEARINFLAEIGWSYKRLEEEGIISPVIGVDCKYKETTTFADAVYITVKVEEFKGVKLKLAYEMKNEAGRTVAEGHSEHCFLGADGRPVRLNKVHPDFCDVLVKLAAEE